MRAVAVLLIVLSLASSAAAGGQAAPQPPNGESGRTPESREVDVDRLPLDLNRIQRQLRHTADLEERDGLNLRYVIQIYGTAPPLDLFSEESNLAHGPVPYGAPTHRELIDHVTPQQFRAPAADFSALIRWLAERNRDKEKGKR